MISLKNLAGLILSGLLLASCTPPYPPGFRNDGPPINSALAPNQPHEKTIAQLERELAERKAEEKSRIAARERSIEAAAQNRVAEDTPRVTKPKTTTNPPPQTKPTTNRKKNYPVARPIPGKAGFIFNPYTNTAVDVRGLPSGALVNDPRDPDKAIHKFRIP